MYRMCQQFENKITLEIAKHLFSNEDTKVHQLFKNKFFVIFKAILFSNILSLTPNLLYYN